MSSICPKKLAIRKGKVVLRSTRKRSYSGSTSSSHFKLKCLKCGYIWNTKYSKIPAICPSCKCKIFNSSNYENITPQKVNSGCFIATAVYGSPLAKEINILRKWRDISLNRNLFGRFCVSSYYKISPPIADYILKKETLKALIRKVLDKYITILSKKYK